MPSIQRDLGKLWDALFSGNLHEPIDAASRIVERAVGPDVTRQASLLAELVPGADIREGARYGDTAAQELERGNVGSALAHALSGVAMTGAELNPITAAIPSSAVLAAVLPVGAKVDDAIDLAKSGKAIYHSGHAPLADEMHKWGVEPQHGPWVTEILKGATDSQELVDDLLENAPMAAWWDDAPKWVRSKVSRAAGKPVSEVTDADIAKHGHLAIADGSDEDIAELVYRIGDEGLDNGPYSRVEDLAGNQMPFYETPLYAHENGMDYTPFGIERNELVTAEAVEPSYSLTGNDLVEFLNKLEGRSGGLETLTDEAAEELVTKAGGDRSVLLEIAQRNAALPVEKGGLGLPADNTPMDRARAMGLTEEGYKAYYPDVYDDAGEYVGPRNELAGFVGDKQTASKFGDGFARAFEGRSVVSPLMVKSGSVTELDNRNLPAAAFQFDGVARDHKSQDLVEAYRAAQADDAIDSVRVRNTSDENDVLVVKDPHNIRSRFAAFDPARKDSRNILASILAGGVALPPLLEALMSERDREEM